MDKTETYIKMCEKAVEVQEAWNFQTRDFFATIGGGSINWHYIWLPRQDQLQAMCFLETHDLLGNLKRFYDWATKWEGSKQGNSTAVWQNGSGFTSMEQLWLAFVMKKKYNKTWDKEDWI